MNKKNLVLGFALATIAVACKKSEKTVETPSGASAVSQALTVLTAANDEMAITLNGYVGTDATNAIDPTTVDAFFDAATYKGAVQVGNDWTTGWAVGLDYTRAAVPTTFTQVISGEVTTNTTLAAGNYQIDGPVAVKNGATLTIEAGATFYAKPALDDGNGGVDASTVAYLLVERGGKIDIQGTSNNPVVFTSGEATPARGDWGGIIINGKAPINNGNEATAEIGGVLYGGTDATDNSGSIRYCRVEYTGNSINADKEHNGFTFNGVGSGTTLAYLQAFMGGDDGMEFFGGTAQAKYLISTGSKDDSFDWTYGWAGKAQYLIAQQDATLSGDRGFEGDNNGSNNEANPYSNPTIANFTLIGGSDVDCQGMKLREGTKGHLFNGLVTGFVKRGIQVEHDVTLNNMINGDLVVEAVSVFYNSGDAFKTTASL